MGTPTTSNLGIQTGLGNVNLGQPLDLPGGADDIGELIRRRTGPAIDLLESGAEEAIRLSQLAQQAGTQPLEQFSDLRAFNEQQALLGTLGAEAQERAIGNIPVTEFDRQLQQRQQQRLLRQANARGELGTGATIESAAQLGGAQQLDLIQRRLQQLHPLVGIARNIRSTQAGIDEASRARQADIEAGLGSQIANIRFGATAPIIQGIQNRAEISGLQGIARANERGQITNQLASLAGQFIPRAPTPQNFGGPTGFGQSGFAGTGGI